MVFPVSHLIVLPLGVGFATSPFEGSLLSLVLWAFLTVSLMCVETGGAEIEP